MSDGTTGAAASEGTARATMARWLRWAATGAVTVFLFRALDLQLEDLRALDAAVWTPRAGWLAASCALLAAGFCVAGLGWGAVVRDLGGPPLPSATAIRIFLVGNLGRYVPGKLWALAGVAALAHRAGVAPPLAVGAAAVGHGFFLVVAAGVATLAPLEAVGGGPREAALAALAVLGIGALMVLAPRMVRRLVRVIGSDRGWAPRSAARWIGIYAVAWALYSMAFWMLLQSFDLPGTPREAGGAFAAAYLVGYLAFFAPAGIGVREAALTAFLVPILGPSAAVGLAVVARLWWSAVELLPAAALWLHRPRAATGSDAPR